MGAKALAYEDMKAQVTRFKSFFDAMLHSTSTHSDPALSHQTGPHYGAMRI